MLRPRPLPTFPAAGSGASLVYDSEHRMPTTHDTEPRVFTRGPVIVSVESLFWHLQRYPRRRVAPGRPPLTEAARPRELEQPYRIGVGRAFRFPMTRRALVIGYWVPRLAVEDESRAILEAVEGAHIPGITATEISEWSRASDVLTWWATLIERVRQWLRPQAVEPAVDDESDDEGNEYRVIPWQA